MPKTVMRIMVPRPPQLCCLLSTSPAAIKMAPLGKDILSNSFSALCHPVVLLTAAQKAVTVDICPYHKWCMLVGEFWNCMSPVGSANGSSGIGAYIYFISARPGSGGLPGANNVDVIIISVFLPDLPNIQPGHRQTHGPVDLVNRNA